MSIVKQIQLIKNVLDMLKDTYPSKIEKNFLNGKINILYDNFLSYCEEGTWIICCLDYWIWKDEDFQDLIDNLNQIFKEEGVDVIFKYNYVITAMMERKNSIQKHNIFIGRLTNTEYHS